MPHNKTMNKSPKKNGLFLSENTILRYVTFSVLYIAQGIPEGITFFAIPAWLAINGKTPTEIASYAAIIIIPWSFKILAGPFMDRYTILSMGRKRPWIILGQLGLIISFLSIGFVNDPLNNLKGLMAVGFCISFFGALQDVATDGLAVDIIPINQQARANGLMWGSKVIGTSLSLFIGTKLINILGFSAAIASISIATAFIILVPICFRERPGEKLAPWTRGGISEINKNNQLKSIVSIFKSLFKVSILPASLFLIIVLFLSGALFGFIDTLLPIFTVQELGWTNTDYSNVYSITSVVAGLLGMLLGGPLVDFFGKTKTISTYLIVFCILIISFGLLSNLWQHKTIIFGFMALGALLNTFLSIALFASSMQLCWKVVSATQFTLYMAISNIGRSLGARLVGYLKDSFDWNYVFLVSALLPLLALISIRFVNFLKHVDTVKTFETKTFKAALPKL